MKKSLAPLMLAAVVASCAFAPSGSTAGPPQQVPFHAVFVVTTSAAANPAPCSQIRIDVAGSGIATHLGRFTTVQHHCTTAGDPLAFTDGEYRFTAANGDQIYGTYAGRFVPIDAAGNVAVDGRFTIGGGTGRFAGATGGGSAAGTGTAAGGTVILEGTITSVGSLQHASARTGGPGPDNSVQGRKRHGRR